MSVWQIFGEKFEAKLRLERYKNQLVFTVFVLIYRCFTLTIKVMILALSL